MGVLISGGSVDPAGYPSLIASPRTLKRSHQSILILTGGEASLALLLNSKVNAHQYGRIQV
ncbi:hypothetical protein [Nostoc sp.]|uniref:hypothetical protein n=1 Tax=Nostoc sp. TaxID=1180 RepID=UPI002FF5EDB9